MGISLRDDFDAAGLRGLAKRCKDAGMARRLLALATIYDGGSRTDAQTRPASAMSGCRPSATGSCASMRQCARSRRIGRRQGARSEVEARRRASALAGREDRGRTDPCRRRRGALAPDRPRAMGLRGVRRHGHQADPQPRAARARLPQALGAASSSREERGGRRGF